jgi:hypothetical protein
MQLGLMAGTSGMLVDDTQERRETRIYCERPECAAVRRHSQCNTRDTPVLCCAGSDPESALPPGSRSWAGEGTFEVIAVATGFLFRFGLMRIGVTMFPTRIRVVTRIETVSFGARLAVRSAILSCRGGLHVALRVSPAIPFTVVRDGTSRRRSFCRSTHNQRAALRVRSRTLYLGSGEAATALLTGIFVAPTPS